MTIYLILGAFALAMFGLIVFLLNQNNKLREEVEKDEAKIKQEEHLIHAMEDVMQEDGRIRREANEKRNKNDKSNSAVAITEQLNSL
jgi:cell division protein FtsL